jgi:hypothetical protein
MYPTITELEAMTPQNVFDHIATHLIRQGRRSHADHYLGLYRGPNSAACAVGAVIPEAAYSEGMEGRGVTGLLWWMADQPGYGRLMRMLAKHHHLLVALQEMHDCRPVDQWPSRLRGIAIAHELSPQIVNDLSLVPACPDERPETVNTPQPPDSPESPVRLHAGSPILTIANNTLTETSFLLSPDDDAALRFEARFWAERILMNVSSPLLVEC